MRSVVKAAPDRRIGCLDVLQIATGSFGLPIVVIIA
jgi:hypothetical protein